MFKPDSQLALEKVLGYKYLRDKDKRCGYVSGLLFFYQIGLTTQVPILYEVVSIRPQVNIGKHPWQNPV